MIWKTPVEPKEGAVRERIIFSVLPRDCTDGYTRWLTRVKIIEEARQSTAAETYANYGIFYRWIEVKAEGI